MRYGLFIFATVCLGVALLIFKLAPSDDALVQCEERDAYVASLWTGRIAIGALLTIGGTGLLFLWAGLEWLHSAVRP